MSSENSGQEQISKPHLSFRERAISAAAGLGLAAVATRPRPNKWLSAIALALGSFLAWRGATGNGPALLDNKRDEN